MNKLTIRDVDVSDKRVLVRVDFNVPLDEKTGAITDDSRIRATLPTIKYLVEREARVILASHLGRPKGKVDEKLRMLVVAQRLSQLLGRQVGITRDCIGAETEKSVESLRRGDVILLENLRFHPAEEMESPLFARALSRLADIFVNDAFGTSHRRHTSVVGVGEYLPAVAGLLLEKEVNTLGHILENPAHPFVTVLGGAKISDKVRMIENIMGKVDCLMIGGGMAATFLKASNQEIGQSLFEEDLLETATRLMDKAKQNGVRLVLPVDVIVTDDIAAEDKARTVPIDEIPPNMLIADIGPQTIKNFYEELRRAKTIFWNGPMGIYERARFAEGTRAVAKLLAGSQAVTIIGGGSTAEIVTNMGLANKMSFVSTGGGASMQFLSGEPLPGVEELLDVGAPVRVSR